MKLHLRAMGSHSVTCYAAQVNTPRLNPSQIGWYSIYLLGSQRDGRLSWLRWLVTCRDGLSARWPQTVAHPSTKPTVHGLKLNSQSVDHKSDALATTLPSHLAPSVAHLRHWWSHEVHQPELLLCYGRANMRLRPKTLNRRVSVFFHCPAITSFTCLMFVVISECWLTGSVCVNSLIISKSDICWLYVTCPVLVCVKTLLRVDSRWSCHYTGSHSVAVSWLEWDAEV